MKRSIGSKALEFQIFVRGPLGFLGFGTVTVLRTLKKVKDGDVVFLSRMVNIF